MYAGGYTACGRAARVPRGFSCGQAGHLHRFGAADLKGLQGGKAGGLWYGLSRVFWGPCWPDFGPCWALRMAWNAGAGARGLGMPIFTVRIHSTVRLYSMAEPMA